MGGMEETAWPPSDLLAAWVNKICHWLLLLRPRRC